MDNIARNGDEIGLYGGRILSKSEIEDWAKMIFKKYGTKLELVEDFGHPSILAQFDATTNTIRHKKDVTKYFLFHETMHADECFSIGKLKYLEDVHIKGTPITDANLLRTYKREKYVHDKIVEQAKEQGFNREELLHNWRYFDTHLYNLEMNNISIPKK